MEYTQENPLPLPPGGAFGEVASTIHTVFDWRYALERKNLMNLYEKGKALAWNATDIDWSIPVDVEALAAQRIRSGLGVVMNGVMQPPAPLNDQELMTFQLHTNAFMLSQFLHGEQGALVATARIVQSAPWEEAKFYAANQVADEARHVEVYHRYLTEKLGVSYPCVASLEQLLNRIMADPRWDITFLGMQIMVEGLALAAFGVQRMQMADEPLIQDILTRVMADESRHVAFGVLALERLYREEMSPADLREREDFVIEATEQLRDRLLITPVFERLGLDPELWTPWSRNTPFMRGFRQMMFAKIVPNLKRLGLLTPRVRAAYEAMDLLRFEHGKDSVEEAEAPPPAELVEFLMQFLQGQSAGAPPAAAV